MSSVFLVPVLVLLGISFIVGAAQIAITISHNKTRVKLKNLCVEERRLELLLLKERNKAQD